MNHKYSICLLLILFFSDPTISQNLIIYLSPTGSDSNPGTKEMPLASLVAACNKALQYRNNRNLNQSIEIIALEGEYFMQQPLLLTHDDSGTDEAPLLIRGEEGRKVIFRGGIKVSGWEQVNEKLWRAFIPQAAYYDSYFEQLYVNGRRAVRARTPNDGFFYIREVTETVLEKGSGRAPQLAVQKIKLDSAGTQIFSSFTNDDFRDAVVTFYHKWDNTRKHIEGFSMEDNAVFIIGGGMKPWNPLDDRTRYFVDNYKAALDAPGEWFLDRSGYLYYIPLKGEEIENSSVFVPVLKEFISIEGESFDRKVSNIRFENMVFEVTGYHTPDAGNEPAQAASPIGAVITLDFARNIEFINCEVAHTGTYAFWFRKGCSDCVVNHCYLNDLGAGGIKIGETTLREDLSEITNSITIDNNIITDGGHIFPCAVGIIIFHASDNMLVHNDISNLRYSGISVGWVWGYSYSPAKRNKIEYNHIHHLGWGELCDMGGVYTLGASEGTTVSNNVVHHIYSFDYGGWGLYTDEGSFGITMANNLVYLCKNSGFHQHYGKENIIRNNIFACNIRSQLQATRIEDHRSLSFANNIIYFDTGTLLSSNWHKFNLLTDYNCYWDTRSEEIKFADMTFDEWQKSGKDIHSVIADPMFVNPEEFNFDFKSLSLTKRIRFIPFDYSDAGVYGSDEWKDLAKIDKQLAEKFNKVVLIGETMK